VLGQILEKQHSMSDELGRDAGAVSGPMRKHANLVQDLQELEGQVKAIPDVSGKLQVAYAGEKATEITNREREEVRAGPKLQAMGESRKTKLSDAIDLLKPFIMGRNLRLWMDDLVQQMPTSEEPRQRRKGDATKV